MGGGGSRGGFPICLIAGTEDPVGNYGKGPEIVYMRLKETGHAAELKLYPGKRHELFNEDNRMEVYEDVKNWLDKHII
ncbi:MAG: alpha/beta hydrolase [Muricomes sp.]